MDKQSFLRQARGLISDAEIAKAIDLAEEFLLKDDRYKLLYREALRLSSIFAKTKRDEEKGIVSFDNAKLNYNQVNDSLLNLLDNIESDNFSPLELISQPMGRNIWRSKWAFTAIIPLLLLGVYAGIKILGNKPGSQQLKQAMLECPEFPTESKFKVMLLRFFLVDGGDYKPEALIYERLDEYCTQNNLKATIRINEGFEAKYLLNYEEAGTLGQECKASMIVWGRAERGSGANIIKARFKYLGTQGSIAFKQLQWQGEKQIDTIKTLSSLTSQGDLTASIEEIIKLVAGVTASESGNIQAAIASLEDLVTTDSTAILLKNMVLADNYIEAKEPQKAVAAYDSLLKVHPKYWIALNNRGMLRMTSGDNWGAIEDFTVALEKRQDPEILAARAKAYQQSDQLNKAKEDYETVIKMKPEKKAEVEQPLQQVDLQIKKEQSFINNLTNSNTNPTKKELWLLSESNKKLGNTEAAKTWLDKGIQLDPRDPQFYASKIEALLREGKTAEAQEVMKAAQENGVKREELFRAQPALKEFSKRNIQTIRQ